MSITGTRIPRSQYENRQLKEWEAHAQHKRQSKTQRALDELNKKGKDRERAAMIRIVSWLNAESGLLKFTVNPIALVDRFLEAEKTQ